MDYCIWERYSLKVKKAGPCRIQNPAYIERLNRVLLVPKIWTQPGFSDDLLTVTQV
ncbi:hypothetical protein NEISICOT_00940 [Neisseria sicca ATCC 29256]|uniref:Uncharacterized protein n=1 Tax=Neisseria sicca ATCC 29256 TaxID=547045 RepID=C6M349_NEISI|nr:hypothetical protein NEISICOT_00940 [Neisseria sicca ATCC 29256]